METDFENAAQSPVRDLTADVLAEDPRSERQQTHEQAEATVTHPALPSSRDKADAAALVQAKEYLTSRFAATAIASNTFPNLNILPRIDPIPFNNLGHMALIDHQRLSETLWGCAAEIKAIVENPPPVTIKKRLQYAVVALLTIGVLGMFIVGSVLASIALAVVSALVVSTLMPTPDPREQVAAIKARYIESLLDRKVPLPPPLKCPEYDALASGALVQVDVGSGLLSPGKMLVFFAKGANDPLPGLGWVQARDTYVCPPNFASSPEVQVVHDRLSLAKGLETIIRKVAEDLRRGDPDCALTMGYLAIVDSEGMQANSTWLDTKGCPQLERDMSGREIAEILRPEKARLPNGDADASGRIFYGIQVYLPRHLTLITIAARVFLASSSAAIEILAVSLGPPNSSVQDLRECLLRHKRLQKAEEKDQPSSVALATTENLQSSNLANFLKGLHYTLGAQHDGLRTPINAATLRETFARFDRQETERRAAKDLSVTSDNAWVGRYTSNRNWREQTSSATPEAFFESPEFKASLRSIYSNVAAAILHGIVRLGYSADAYRDARGNITFVEKMFIGGQHNQNVERVTNVSQGDHGTVTTNQTSGKSPNPDGKST